MAEGVNVRVSGRLRRFIEEQAGADGLYESASEYVRDLIRRDYERQEARKWAWLVEELGPAVDADESAFEPFDPEDVIATAKKEKAARAP